MEYAQIILRIFIIALLPTPALTNTLSLMMANSYQEVGEYYEPNAAEMAVAERVLSSLMQTRAVKEQDIKDLRALSLGIQKLNEAGQSYLIISELDPKRRAGRGFFIINLKSSSQRFLQAPHRPSDLYTYEILLALLGESDYRGAAINTLGRKTVDLAKATNSYFNAFTTAMAKSFKAVRLIQLHGFNSTKHGTDASMILSTATHDPARYALLEPIKKCLESKTGFSKIYLYPREIKKLGGTLNINAKILYAANPQALYIQVEMDKFLRKNLKDNKQMRAYFSQCF